ncbi:MAG: zinc ribbon domain-containing protein [Thermoplasmata archaeon]|nr:zinc ribbon domain-containing protein [Thermoplasmata archaeon]
MGFFNRKKKEKPKKIPGEDEVACPNCGTLIHKDARMCYACGTMTK